jgi:peptidyl-tRNA hydrolase, PTH1 family
MKLIVGLGNPGNIYAESRHNVGFSVVKFLAIDLHAPLKKDSSVFSLSGKAKIEGQVVVSALPLTFMNLSGIAVSALVKKYKIDLSELLVVYDDLDLEFGRMKLRPCGSSGGHLGLKSIIEYLATSSFARLRIGISRPSFDRDPAEYVLGRFTKKESAKVKLILEEAVLCCKSWVTSGIVETMNIFNNRSRNE